MSWLSFFARRFVAGETVEQAIRAVRILNQKGVKATLDILGENVNSAAQAEACARGYVALLDEIARSGVDSNVSVKLTMLGLDIGEECCLKNVRLVLDKAKALNNFVRIDMEGSAYTQRTLDLFARLRQEYGPGVGIVIQAYLHRSAADMKALAAAAASVRLCKGAYKEPPQAALQNMRQIRANYAEILQAYLRSGAPLAIATHDETLIRGAIAFVEADHIPRSRFEFQMLYGIRRKRAESLAAAGYTMRAYVPYGTHWFPYFYRRLRERKENVLFILSNLFRD